MAVLVKIGRWVSRGMAVASRPAVEIVKYTAKG